MKIQKLSPEQELKIVEIRNKWTDYIFSCKNSINKEAAKVGIDWLYKFCGYKEPIIINVSSPIGCQYAVQLLKAYTKVVGERSEPLAQVWDQVGDQVWDQVWDQVRDQVRDQVGDQVWDQVGDQVWDQVGDQVGDQVWDQVRDQIGDQVRAQVWAQVWDQVRDQVRAQVRAQVWDQVWDQVRDQVRDQVGEYESFAAYGGVTDYGWVSFYDFFKSIGVNLNNPNFEIFKNLIQSGIYDMIQLNGFCIVSDLPDKIKRNRLNRLHAEDESAIHFKDGYELYFWNGISVPMAWIMNKESITKKEILSEKNAEKRRCLREILGVDKYFGLLGGVQLLDQDIDENGNSMELFESKEKDEMINKKIQYLQVICPSTKRKYILYPPNQSSTNVWKAKASTFENKAIAYRHGDVGILDLNKSHSKPLIET